jgi:hypothetical protein
MQTVRTEISRTTAPTGEPILRVLFYGEGGDCVTVDMASTEATSDDAALDRARVILVQVATFDLPRNGYDAESNGNFDEVAVTAGKNSENCEKYIFEYRDGQGSRQVPLSRMPSFEAAREEAVRSAIDLLVDLQPGTDALFGWLVRVRNERGDLLCVIDVQEAEAARRARQ